MVNGGAEEAHTMRLTFLLWVMCSIVGVSSNSAVAQQVPLRGLVEYNLALSALDTGECGYFGAVAGGLQFQSQGQWFASTGIDAVLPFAGLCDGPGSEVWHNGRWLSKAESYKYGPRLLVFGGRTLGSHGIILDPSIGVGIVYGLTNYPAEQVWRIGPWTGARLTVRWPGTRAALRAEYGVVGAPTRYQDTHTVYQHFTEWRSSFQLGVALGAAMARGQRE
jgi:hypothetical protein